jgi:phospholipid/cholesterol/gamma-HCH transport system permease protein
MQRNPLNQDSIVPGMSAAQLSLSQPGAGVLRVQVSGSWALAKGLPSTSEVEKAIDQGAALSRLSFEAANLETWDSSLVNAIYKLVRHCKRAGVPLDLSGLPEGVRGLLDLAEAVVPRQEIQEHLPDASFLADVGSEALEFFRSVTDILRFVGGVSVSLGRMLRGRARYRGSDLFLIVQQVGAQALPIVSLISVLVGLILAFVGAVQLEQFGANVFIANLVGLGMVRDMGAMMAAIIMAGRTGAAYAAELGTMTVNEEIDALRTMGISPIDFLVVPRILALVLMMPILTLYADLMGILGGALVGVTLFDIGFYEYFRQTQSAIDLLDVFGGLFKGLVYGAIVAVSGCLRGMECGRSSAAVGAATTSAVVTGIVFIVVACAILTVAYDILGI